jgi:hypothetical protein
MIRRRADRLSGARRRRARAWEHVNRPEERSGWARLPRVAQIMQHRSYKWSLALTLTHNETVTVAVRLGQQDLALRRGLTRLAARRQRANGAALAPRRRRHVGEGRDSGIGRTDVEQNAMSAGLLLG